MATEPNTNNQQITTNSRVNNQSTTNNHQQLLVRSYKLVVRSYKLVVPSRQSFTLIEILIVVALIAVLAVAIVLYLNPSDPIKQTSTGNYYNQQTGKYEINTRSESTKRQELVSSDGGDNSNVYEQGQNLSLMPNSIYPTNSNVWLKTIGGTSTDPISYIQQTSDGGYIISGWSFGAEDFDALIVKLDSSGNISWSKTIGGANNDYINSIQQTSDGGYIIGGYTNSFGAGNDDALIAKLDSSGNISWSKTIGGTNNDSIYSIQRTSDGGYIVGGEIGGEINDFGAVNTDALIVKLDSSENISWAKKIGGKNYEFIYSIQQTSDGGYIIGGITASFGAGNFDGLIVKLDSSGNISWAKTIGGTNTDSISYIQQTLEGGYIVGGVTESFGAGKFDALIVKLDSSGNISWAKTIGGTNGDAISSIQQTSDGGYIIGGNTASFGAGYDDVFIFKLDSSGNISWAKTIGGKNYEYIASIQQISDGGYIVGGYTNSFGAGYNDALIVKLDSSGNCSNCSFIQSVNPTVTLVSPTVNSPSLTTTSTTPTVTSISPTVTSPNLIVNTYCPE